MCQNNDPELCPLSYIKLRNLKLNFEEPKITKKMEKKPILRLQDLVSSNGFKTTPSPVFKVNYLKIECKGCQYEYPNGAIKKHLFTYYKCNEYYQKNPEFKKALDKILKERNLEDTSKIPKPQHNLLMDCQSFLSPYDTKWFGKFTYRDRHNNKMWNNVLQSKYGRK